MARRRDIMYSPAITRERRFIGFGVCVRACVCVLVLLFLVVVVAVCRCVWKLGRISRVIVVLSEAVGL